MFLGCYGFYGGKVKVIVCDAEVLYPTLGEKSALLFVLSEKCLLCHNLSKLFGREG